MKTYQMSQGTPAWKAFRGKGLGASDAPVIMGDSPYNTPFKLWAEKAGLINREEPNAYQLQAMNRGNELEPKVRARFEAEIGMKFPPIVAEHDLYPHIRASLDGYNAEHGINLEIKCCSKVEYEAVLKKKVVTPKYRAQVAQQAIVTGASKSYFVCFYSDELPLAIAEVPTDPIYNQQVLDTLNKFWNHVQKQTPPSFGKQDVVAVFKTVTSNYDKFAKAFGVMKLMVDSMEDEK